MKIQVEELLTSYLKDVGITEEQFVLACEAGSNDSSRVPDRVSYILLLKNNLILIFFHGCARLLEVATVHIY